MILVVIVAFTILMGTYVFVRSIADNEATLKEWKKEIETSQTSEHHKIAAEVIKEIKKEIEKLHRSEEPSEDR
jgi:hypothetical protein